MKPLGIHRFARGVLVVATTCAVTLAIVLFVAAHAFTAKPGDWSIPMRFGVLGMGPTLDTSVATLLRVATHPVGIALLDGRSIETRAGTLHFTKLGVDSMAVDCAPCALRLPGLGDDRIAVGAARLTVLQRADRLSGAILAGDIAGHYVGRFDAHGLQLDIDLDQAPIAAYFRLFGDAVPEARVASIRGTASFTLRVALPDGRVAVKPTIEGFTVSGLGTELLAGRLPDVRCGEAAARVRGGRAFASFGNWLPRAVIAAEDQRFDEHPGYDLAELAASLSRNGSANRIERGASTIPQQLARLLYVGSERSLARKLRELLYAVEMEQTLGKPRMLQLYLAVAPWGEGTCGATAAAQRYFGVAPSKLTGAQAVWLAAMLHAPDTEFDRWQARGGIDLARATWVARGLPKTTRKTRERVIEDLTAMGPSTEAESVGLALRP